VTPNPLHESINANRTVILAAADEAMQQARARRTRNARAATAAIALALAAAGSLLFTKATPSAEKSGALALDFATVTEVAQSLDFQRFAATTDTKLDFGVITDAELEAALGETGYCVKGVRLSEGVRLVDCSTGAEATIRDPTAPIR
jgi:hypothetical protein